MNILQGIERYGYWPVWSWRDAIDDAMIEEIMIFQTMQLRWLLMLYVSCD